MRISYGYPYGYDTPTFCEFCGDAINGKVYDCNGINCCKDCFDAYYEDEEEDEEDDI